jgi:hypothetical protein
MQGVGEEVRYSRDDLLFFQRVNVKQQKSDLWKLGSCVERLHLLERACVAPRYARGAVPPLVTDKERLRVFAVLHDVHREAILRRVARESAVSSSNAVLYPCSDTVSLGAKMESIRSLVTHRAVSSVPDMGTVLCTG